MKNDRPAVIKEYDKTCTDTPLSIRNIDNDVVAVKVKLTEILSADEIRQLIIQSRMKNKKEG